MVLLTAARHHDVWLLTQPHMAEELEAFLADHPVGARVHLEAVGPPYPQDRLTDQQRAFNRMQAGLRALVEQAIGHLANAWALRRWRGLLHRVRDVSGPPARWSAWAGGWTVSPPERASRTPSFRSVHGSA
jgi:hypothetical protein